MRVLMYYLLSYVALMVYGGQVCPFLESLSLSQLGAPLGIAFVLAFVARGLLTRRLVLTARFTVLAGATPRS